MYMFLDEQGDQNEPSKVIQLSVKVAGCRSQIVVRRPGVMLLRNATAGGKTPEQGDYGVTGRRS